MTAPSDPACVVIAALDEDRVIGDDGAIPWDIPEDMEHFRELTMGHPVVVGRRTFESMPELDGRQVIVLSESLDPSPKWPNAIVARSLASARASAIKHCYRREVNKYFVAGGASVYEQFLDEGLVDRMQLTEVAGSHDGDARFPEVDWTRWDEADAEAHHGFRFVTYV